MDLLNISFGGPSTAKNIFLSSSVTEQAKPYVAQIDTCTIDDDDEKLHILISTPTTSTSSSATATSTIPSFTPNQSFPTATWEEIDQPYSMEFTLMNNGYTIIQNIAPSLQGSVWNIQNKQNKQFIMKSSEKSLHRNSITMVNGKPVVIQEDIIKEMKIMKYLSSHHPPKGIIRYIDFIEDEKNYLLILEHGGNDLFTFIQKAHELILANKLKISEWHRFCKRATKQMVEIIDWLHNKMHCIHFDVSLENFVISDVGIKIHPKSGKMTFVMDFQIKIIDFGLSELFSSSSISSDVDFNCCKFAVFKPGYQSPEIIKQVLYDARSADVWSLGVTLFSMIVGVPPFHRACMKDIYFQYIISGHLYQVLGQFERIGYVNKTIFNLMYCIFKPQNKRIDIYGIKTHQWLKEYVHKW